jgi:hypothetical protein
VRSKRNRGEGGDWFNDVLYNAPTTVAPAATTQVEIVGFSAASVKTRDPVAVGECVVHEIRGHVCVYPLSGPTSSQTFFAAAVGIYVADWDTPTGRFEQRNPFNPPDVERGDWRYLDYCDCIISGGVAYTSAFWRQNIHCRIKPTRVKFGQALYMVCACSSNSGVSMSVASFQSYRVQAIR